MLEMDRLERELVSLPLLQDPSSYVPDTVDLTEDAMAREYWLSCFEEALEGVDTHTDFDKEERYDPDLFKIQLKLREKGQRSGLGLIWTTEVVTLDVFGPVFWTGSEESHSQPA